MGHVWGREYTVLTRLVWFIGYAIIAFLVAWLLVTVVGIVPVIPEALKSVLEVVIWVVSLIAVILLGMRMFAGNLPSVNPPA
jgi:hypothetical protein